MKPLGKMGVKVARDSRYYRITAQKGVVGQTRKAAVVVRYLDGLVSRGYTGSIGVVAPFRAQANEIRELVSTGAYA